jgi:hypothetical protein
MTQSLIVSSLQFVLAGTAAMTSGALNSRGRGGEIASPASEELLNLAAHVAVALMTRGDLSAQPYSSALLPQCESGKSLNAFITLDKRRFCRWPVAATYIGVPGATDRLR